jgi:methylmalonyl-CoA/ethylmalonyl-CoA epimerase
MGKVQGEKSIFSRLDHFGLVVRDMDRAVDHFQSLGIGPFQSFRASGLAYKERELMGRPIAPDSNIIDARQSQIGPIRLELIQPVQGESLWKEFLDTKGEGINHLCFLVDDIEKEEAKLVRGRLRVLYKSRFKNGGGATYFDTGEIGGVLLELIQRPLEG